MAQVSSVQHYVLDTTILDRMTVQAKPKAREIVHTYGIIIAGDSSATAPVYTSALKNSLVSESKMTGDMEYTVQDGVEYGIFQELGTSRMSAQPFMIPSVEGWKERFFMAFVDIFR